MVISMDKRYLYIFLDEAGNLDFSPSGTRYFMLSSITKERPFAAYRELIELKYDLVERGMNIEYFHATEDKQDVRDRVFAIIERHMDGIQVDSLIVEKRKVDPALRADARFYPEMLGYLIGHILVKRELTNYTEVIVFTDRIPINKKRNAIEKAVKATLNKMLPADARYRIYHHDSKSNLDLQIADYCSWAIYRKWERGDERSYTLIQPIVQSELDIFSTVTRTYY